MIPYLLLPSAALISIQPAFMPDADILSLATAIHENAIEIIHDRSLKAHGPSAQWSRYALIKVHAGLPALFAHLPETKRPPLVHIHEVRPRVTFLPCNLIHESLLAHGAVRHLWLSRR